MMTSGFYYAVGGFFATGLYFLRAWIQGKRCDIVKRLDGKTVVITGGNTGEYQYFSFQQLFLNIFYCRYMYFRNW